MTDHFDGRTADPGRSMAGGRYEVLGTLGSGGMGIVVRARDRHLDRFVAIKVLADNLALDEEARQRFLREGHAAARLNHRNVVQVFDVGEEDGRPFLVMELVDGPSLADVLASEGPLDGGSLRDVARQALAALEHAHEAGLLHRDIKPANLLRDADGTVKVTDFGVADVAEAPSLTRTGHVVGTLPYLPPERLAGGPATEATDIYALGATLYQLATGRSPREERTLADVPAAVRPLVDACLAEDPRNRPASASEARRALEDHEPTRALPETEPMGVPTSAAPPPRADATTRDLDPARRGEDERGRPAGSTAGEPPWVRWRIALLVAIGAVLLITAMLAFGDDGPDAPTAGPTPTEGTAVEPVERGGDPATTARNLADWIRDHAGR